MNSMKRIILISLLIFLASSCGNKGDLYHPKDEGNTKQTQENTDTK